MRVDSIASVTTCCHPPLTLVSIGASVLALVSLLVVVVVVVEGVERSKYGCKVYEASM